MHFLDQIWQCRTFMVAGYVAVHFAPNALNRIFVLAVRGQKVQDYSSAELAYGAASLMAGMNYVVINNQVDLLIAPVTLR